MINNQRGGVTIVLMAVVAGVMAMTLGASYSYISNRARWQIRIREAYRINFVVEAMAKYIKDASDRYNSCVDATGTNICGGSCAALGAGFFFLQTTPAITVPVSPARQMCFTLLTECNGIQNSGGLGIKFLDNAAIGGQSVYCMTRATAGDLAVTDNPALPVSKFSPTENSDVNFIAMPLVTEENRPTFANRVMEKYDRWFGTDIYTAITAVHGGDLSYKPRPWPFNLIGKAEAFMKNALYTTAPVGAPVLARGVDLSIAGACSSAPSGLVDEQCARRCLPNRPCMTFAICPSIVAGCGTDGLGAGPADVTLLVRSTVIVMGMGAAP